MPWRVVRRYVHELAWTFREMRVAMEKTRHISEDAMGPRNIFQLGRKHGRDMLHSCIQVANGW